MTKSLQPSRSTSSANKLDVIRELNLRAILARADVEEILRKYEVREPLPELKKLRELTQVEAEAIVIKLFQRFHNVAISLRKRRRKKPAIYIEDEYAVQDIFEALLKIYFDDVRPEDPTPKVAGGFSFIDFILKRQKIGIETKFAREGHTNIDIKDELTLDKDYYRKHTDCTLLLCLVYDPDHKIENPTGFEVDLSDNISGLETKVFIVPKP